MERIFALNGATTGPGVDLLTDLQVTRDAGFRALEIRDTKLEAYLARGGTLEGLRSAFTETKVEPLSLNALEDATLVSDERRDAVLARCRVLSEWAAALRCPFIVAVPSLLSQAGDQSRATVPPAVPGPEEIRSRAVEMLRAMGAIARFHGVRLGFEFLGFERCSVRTIADAYAIVRAVDDPSVGLVIDSFHAYVGGSSVDSLADVDAEDLFLVHVDDAEDQPPAQLTDAHRLLPGEGVIPLVPLVTTLERLGYRGAYSVELFRPEYWEWAPLRLARAAHASLDRVFAAVDEETTRRPTA